MITSETAVDAQDVLDEVLELERGEDEWSRVDAAARRLKEAIEAGDDSRARDAVAELGRYTKRLPPVEVDPQPPPEGLRTNLEIVNKLVRSVVPGHDARAGDA